MCQLCKSCELEARCCGSKACFDGLLYLLKKCIFLFPRFQIRIFIRFFLAVKIIVDCGDSGKL